MTNKVRKPFVMKQFTIAHHQVALPVTSDACLFGAMIQLSEPMDHAQPYRLLDIGTGTGLLCFMLAQNHPRIHCTGIDIHQSSVDQATENLKNNPFADRIRFDMANILQYTFNEGYHGIVCNPPFFENQLPSEDDLRRLARHSNTLNLSNLIASCAKLLLPNGELFLLYPSDGLANTCSELEKNQFRIVKTTFIQANPKKKPHLVIIHARYKAPNASFSIEPSSETVIHYTSEGKLSDTATHYLQEFYSQLP
jgi:tRNA1Val (adenine37-N6)-methyltransferase